MNTLDLLDYMLAMLVSIVDLLDCKMDSQVSTRDLQESTPAMLVNTLAKLENIRDSKDYTREKLAQERLENTVDLLERSRSFQDFEV